MMMLRDKAVVTVEQIIGCKGLWDFLHSPAKLILLELVSAELDPSKEKVEETGLEKDTIKAYAHGVKEGGNVKYEAEFKGGKILGRLVRLLLRMSTTKKYFWRKYSLLVSQRVRLLSSSYLPSQTPSGLRALRKEELKVLRGNGKGERKWFERVYDYDVCNDIGDPDCDPSKTRPVLGGKGLPYLRRCRTGCPPCPRDHESEAKSNNVYVPRDECFSEVKQQKLREKTASSLLHPLIPSLRRRIIGFPNFAAIDQLFDEGMESPPQGDTFFWLRDESLFGKPLLESTHMEWPLQSKLDPDSYGPPESTITKEMIECEIKGYMTLDEVPGYGGLPKLMCWLMIPSITSLLLIVSTYNFHSTCRLRTHGATEPYIIATNQQLSVLHPIYKLLHPHFRFTMKINALARAHLINADGTIESSFSLANYSMEFSSVAYDIEWRFDHQAFPADLISRGMAMEDPTAPHGLRLKSRITLSLMTGFFPGTSLKNWSLTMSTTTTQMQVSWSHEELQAWWTEIREVGHGDKKDESWWPVLRTPKDLIQIVTTIAWVSSGHHTAVNFGQYEYAGYFPNRPTIARRNMPNEDPSEED
ncbi:hypothetical protein SCA6_002522 [Theobroma cacao]